MSDFPESPIEDIAEIAAAATKPPVTVLDADMIRRIVEASLLASSQPLTVQQLYALFPEDAPAPKDSIEQALQTLRTETENRGVELIEVASGFRYQVRADVHPWVARLWTERSTRYTRATLETLALIAYRQPITRGEIEQIRGVAVSSNIIKLLEERDFIRVIGHRDVPGRPALFGTTRSVLDYFGLKSLDELPPLAEIRDLTEIDPQLPFDTSVAEGHVQPTLSPSGEGEPFAERTVGEGLPDDATPNEVESIPQGFPNLNDATDVFIHPSIPATAALNGDTDTLNSPDDAGDDAASEHTA